MSPSPNTGSQSIDAGTLHYELVKFKSEDEFPVVNVVQFRRQWGHIFVIEATEKNDLYWVITDQSVSDMEASEIIRSYWNGV